MKKRYVFWLVVFCGCGNATPVRAPDIPQLCAAPQKTYDSPQCEAGAPLAPMPDQAPCRLTQGSSDFLAVTTTDFATGALSIVDTRSRQVYRNVALASTDALPFYNDGLVYIVNRFGFDYVDVLDPCGGFALRRQWPVRRSNVASANPQSLVFRNDNLAFLSLYGSSEVLAVDFEREQPVLAALDLSAYADHDGNAEASAMVACGDIAYVALQRLHRFKPGLGEVWVPLNLRSCTPAQNLLPIDIPYGSTRQIRHDPKDPTGHTVLVLNESLLRVNLETSQVTVVVHPDELRAAAISGLQLQSFALDAQAVYLAAYTPDFSRVQVWRRALDAPPGTPLQVVIDGLNSVERTLEVVDDTLWYGDTTLGGSGMRVFDLGGDFPRLAEGPLDLGLPPYSVAPLGLSR